MPKKISLMFFTAVEFLKAKAAPQGAVRTWSDGNKYKKTGSKWVRIAEGKGETRQEADAWRRGKDYFDAAMTTRLGDIVDEVLYEYDITDYDSLVDYLKGEPNETASMLFRQVVDRAKAEPAAISERKAVIDMFGKTLINVRDWNSTGAKTNLTVKKTSKTGKEYYGYEEGAHTKELPSIKPSVVKAEKEKLGGWDVTGELKTDHVRKMLDTGAAELVSGKPDSRKKWVMPKKHAGIEMTYKGEGLKVQVKQVAQKEHRTRATAKVNITIPYAFAKAFMLNQDFGKKLRNNVIFRMEHSQGYRDYLKRAGTTSYEQ